MNTLLKILLWSQLLLAMFILLAFVNREEDALHCKAVNIAVDNEATGHYFIESKDVQNMLDEKGIATVKNSIQSIHPGAIEKMLCSNPYIENAEVYLTVDGDLSMEIKQRNPILRVINA